MPRVFVLGAGASISYGRSPTGVRPPLARGFFQAFKELPLAADGDVPIGSLINYVRDLRGLPFERFGEFDEDIESFMTRLESDVRRLGKYGSEREKIENVTVFQAYSQTVFLLGLILNEICSGPSSQEYRKLALDLTEEDLVVTFNWDTLLDRALWEIGSWSPEHDYGVQFRSVMDDGWRAPEVQNTSASPRLLKLHGSTNWLVNYIAHNPSTGELTALVPKRDDGRTMASFGIRYRWDEQGRAEYWPEINSGLPYSASPVHELDNSDLAPHLYIQSRERYVTFRDRWRPGYAPFTCFFPPNLPPHGAVLSMPLIVPPVKEKPFEYFRHILDPLWREAQRAIEQADLVVVIGYSFPATDTRAANLFRPVDGPRAMRRRIELVNPWPEQAIESLTNVAGVPRSSVEVVARSFEEFLNRL